MRLPGPVAHGVELVATIVKEESGVGRDGVVLCSREHAAERAPVDRAVGRQRHASVVERGGKRVHGGREGVRDVVGANAESGPPHDGRHTQAALDVLGLAAEEEAVGAAIRLLLDPPAVVRGEDHERVVLLARRPDRAHDAAHSLVDVLDGVAVRAATAATNVPRRGEDCNVRLGKGVHEEERPDAGFCADEGHGLVGEAAGERCGDRGLLDDGGCCRGRRST